VLLEIVANARNVSGNFHAAAQLDASNFAQGRVWFLGGSGVHTGTYAAPLGRALESRAIRGAPLGLASFADELLNSRQNISVVVISNKRVTSHPLSTTMIPYLEDAFVYCY
jgi:hypothetical protein